MKKPEIIKKHCSCKRIHSSIPANAREFLSFNEDVVEGWMWECDCGSTLLILTEEAQEKKNRIKRAN